MWMAFKTIFRRLTEFLGLRRNIVYLLSLTVLILTGEKLWDRYLPKYLESIGATTLIIGGLGFLQNILGAFWSLPGGYLSDKLGHRKSFFLFNLMAIGGYLFAILFTSWIAVFIGIIFFSAWSAVSLPASMSLITNSLGHSKTAMGISMHSIIRRIPMAAGPVAGGLLISRFGRCLDVIKISPEKFGVLTAIEMMTAALIYIPVASFSDKTERKPFVVVTFVFFTIFPVILYFSKSFIALVTAFIVRGLKEFGEPTRKAIILDLSPKEAKARGFGLYYFVRDFVVSFAAFFGGWLWKQNPVINLFTATAFGVVGTLLFIFYGKGTNIK